jgi:hypothetical protein
LAKYPYTGLREKIEELHRRAARLVTIKEVFAECVTVPLSVVQQFHVLVEPTQRPHGSAEQLRLFRPEILGGIFRLRRANLGFQAALIDR